MDDTAATLDPGVDPATLAARLAEEQAPDIVDALKLRKGRRSRLRSSCAYPVERAVEVLDQPGLDGSAEIVEALPRDKVAVYLAGMSADRVADVLREIEEPTRSDLLARLDADTKSALEKLLSYPEGSAGAIMTTEFVSVPATWTVTQTLDDIRVVRAYARDGLFHLCPRATH